MYDSYNCSDLKKNFNLDEEKMSKIRQSAESTDEENSFMVSIVKSFVYTDFNGIQYILHYSSFCSDTVKP